MRTGSPGRIRNRKKFNVTTRNSVIRKYPNFSVNRLIGRTPNRLALRCGGIFIIVYNFDLLSVSTAIRNIYCMSATGVAICTLSQVLTKLLNKFLRFHSFDKICTTISTRRFHAYFSALF